MESNNLQTEMARATEEKCLLWEKMIFQGNNVKPEDLGQAPKVSERAFLNGEEVEVVTCPEHGFDELRQLLRSLKNRHLVSYKGFISNPQCLVFEYCHNGSLGDLLAADKSESKKLPLQKFFSRKKKDDVECWARLLNIVLDVAKAMWYLHNRENPIVHCNLSSWNVRIRSDGTAVVCGLEIKWISKESSCLTPEVECRGQAPSCKTDVFCFAIILWEVLTGKQSWEGMNLLEISSQLRLGQRPPVSHRFPTHLHGIQEVESLMKLCWAESPDDRPDFSEICSKLSDLVDRLPPPGGNSSQRQPAARLQCQHGIEGEGL